MMNLAISLVLFFLAVIIHEYSHGWVAWKLGDSTAKMAGRLTLNPAAHIDPIGTILLPLILLVTHSPVLFGWAKPVPVDFQSLHNPKKDMVWVSLAGPGANILLAVILSFILKLAGAAGNPLFVAVTSSAIIINLVLAIFNILPIPPLDGSRVVMGLLPIELSVKYARIEPYGLVIIFGLLYLGLIGNFIWPLVTLMARFLGVSI
ncbi:MAG: site-2 protease family protein [Candidatus Omnitrophica bacterium]|nr:site-2 protease family protein [Candidatus Omnitrophota bacterium]MBU1932736.1 site-2 protease family protein [Candidatus Omnitrophota bacterium]